MDIVYLENDWIRLVILQNFHYLLADSTWRGENDWIHRKPDGTLENFKESIEKRATVNIRKRVKDDALAIKDFYYNDYKNKNYPIHICFPTAEDFNHALDTLKSTTFVSVLSLHYILRVLTEMNRSCQELQKMILSEIQSKNSYVQNRKEKALSMLTQFNHLRELALRTADKPLETTIRTPALIHLKGLTNVAFNEILPEKVRLAAEQNIDSQTQITIISDYVIDLMKQISKFNTDEFLHVERRFRKRRDYDKRMSKQAVFKENRIKIDFESIKKNVEPAYKKPPRTEKLKNSFIVKKTKKAAPPAKTVSKRTRFFFEAFHAEDEDFEAGKRNSIDIMDTIQESNVPFYFDYFLSLHDYKPNYNFKTKTEIRDGPEEDLVKVRSLLPNVEEKMYRWEQIKKKVMETNIRNHPEMYTNIVN
ncbi:CCDC37 family protein [Megaselia abdita]